MQTRSRCNQNTPTPGPKIRQISFLLTKLMNLVGLGKCWCRSRTCLGAACLSGLRWWELADCLLVCVCCLFVCVCMPSVYVCVYVSLSVYVVCLSMCFVYVCCLRVYFFELNALKYTITTFQITEKISVYYIRTH